MSTSKRGFASFTSEKRRTIARIGGLSALKRHKFTHEEAVLAGKKGKKKRVN